MGTITPYLTFIYLFPASQDLSSAPLLIFLGSLYCKQYGPWSNWELSDLFPWELSDQGSYCLLPWKHLFWSALEQMQQPYQWIICSSHLLIFLGILYCEQYLPESVWSGFILFASMKKSSLKCNWTYAADIPKHIVCSSCLLIFIGSLYCKQYRVCSLGSSLIWVHMVCFHEYI